MCTYFVEGRCLLEEAATDREAVEDLITDSLRNLVEGIADHNLEVSHAEIVRLTEGIFSATVYIHGEPEPLYVEVR